MLWGQNFPSQPDFPLPCSTDKETPNRPVWKSGAKCRDSDFLNLYCVKNYPSPAWATLAIN